MKLSDLGEFNLIDRFSVAFKKDLPANTLGIGDDCAVIISTSETALLVTVDALAEDVHFLRSAISPADLGHKSLAVNLSDIAAMGGTPENVFLSLCLPSDLDVEWLDQFFIGFGRLAKLHKVNLLGGDTTRSAGKIFISVTALGSAVPAKIKYRSQAKLNDLICVTDFLGDSAAGLRILLNKQALAKDVSYFVNRHHLPEPQLNEGQFLGNEACVHAMMDISDGVHSDIQRILQASKCGAKLFLEQFPLSPQLKTTASQLGWDPYEIATFGGEDYGLLFTVDPSQYSDLAVRYFNKFNRPIYQIGEITNQPDQLDYFMNENKITLEFEGFAHFGGKD